MEDNKIVELFFSRSEQAIAELSYKYGDICKKISFNILNDMQDAEECVNDTYLGVWNSIPPNNPDSLIAYTCKIARNLSLKKFRYNTAQKRNNYFDIPFAELKECIPVTNNKIDQYTEEDLSIIIEQFLDSLDKNSRIMFIKRYWFAESIQDIAKEYGMKENHISVKMLRIRKKMKKYLEQKGVII